MITCILPTHQDLNEYQVCFNNWFELNQLIRTHLSAFTHATKISNDESRFDDREQDISNDVFKYELIDQSGYLCEQTFYLTSMRMIGAFQKINCCIFCIWFERIVDVNMCFQISWSYHCTENAFVAPSPRTNRVSQIMVEKTQSFFESQRAGVIYVSETSDCGHDSLPFGILAWKCFVNKLTRAQKPDHFFEICAFQNNVE